MEWNKVYQGDCDVILPILQNKGMTFDLILTDPPYNINKDFGNTSDQLSLDEFLSVSKARISICRNLLADDGSIIWFGIHHYIGYIQVIMYELGLYYRRSGDHRRLHHQERLYPGRALQGLRFQ